MAYSSPIGVIAQNLFLHWSFAAGLLVAFILTGAWKTLLLSLVLASAVSAVYRKFVNKQLPPPRKSAVVITGCSTGIGFDTAIKLSKLGLMTFATVRKTEDADKLRKAAGNSAMLIPVICDVTIETDRTKALETVKSKMAGEGRKLIALINNAGFCESTPIELASTESMHKQFETNVFSVIHLSQICLPLLRQAASDKHWARIINISSVAGRLQVPGTGLYSASKHALEAITGAMRMELAKWKIHVCTVEPGAIGTSFYTTATSSVEKASKVREQLKQKGKIYCSDDVVQSYVESEQKQISTFDKIPMESSACVTDAILAGLLDSRPLACYMAAWQTIPLHILLHLPAEISDKLAGQTWA